jgi:hypothetical protein
MDAGTDAGPVDGGSTDVCPAGSLTLSGRCLDMCATLQAQADVPLAGVQVTTLDPWGSTTSASDGTFSLCVPSGVPFTVQTSLASYVTAYLAEAVISQDTAFQGNRGGILLLCQAGAGALSLEIPGFNPAQGAVIADATSASKTGVCGNQTGWFFDATLVDGGLPPGVDGGWPETYLTATGTPDMDSGTQANGLAFIYGIDPSVSTVFVEAINPTVGASCPSSDQALGFTGNVHVAGNSLGYIPWLIP